jgi:Tol biopolymer transport system component
VAFQSNRAGNPDIFLRRADASGEEKALTATPGNEMPSDWSRDGRYLLYHTDAPAGADLWYLERNGDGSAWEPHLFSQSAFDEVVPRISPDGRYVAYVSNESGRGEVYVQPFPEGGRKVTVSSNGGAKVRWSPDGKELFYIEGETLVAVSVSTEGDFSADEATRLFEHPSLRLGELGNFAHYDVSADGQRFILPEPAGEGADAPEPSIHVVENWFEEFRAREKN